MKTLFNTFKPAYFSFTAHQTNPLKRKNLEKMEWLETSGDGSYVSATVDGHCVLRFWQNLDGGENH